MSMPMIKVFLLTGILILFIGCWPKVKIAGDEYIIVPGPLHGGNVAIPPKSKEDSGSGSDSGSKDVKPQSTSDSASDSSSVKPPPK